MYTAIDKRVDTHIRTTARGPVDIHETVEENSQQQTVSGTVEIVHQNQSLGRWDPYSSSRKYTHHKIGDVTVSDTTSV